MTRDCARERHDDCDSVVSCDCDCHADFWESLS